MTADAAYPAAAGTVSEDALLGVVRGLYAEVHRSEPAWELVTPDSGLENDLGFDSLTRVELLRRLDQRFQVHVPDSTLATARTVADLSRALANARGQQGAIAPVRPSVARVHGRVPSRTDAAALARAATLQDALAWHAGHQPDATHVILLDDAGPMPLSYRTLYDAATRAAFGLRRLGVGTGDTVALMLPTGLEYFQAFFGVLLAGAIAVPIYPPFAAQLEEHVRRHTALLRNAGVRALITSGEVSAVARLLRARVATLRCVTSVPELLRQSAGAGRSSAPPDPLRPRGGDGEQLALLQYTSGSTGSPKGVMLSHRQILANLRALGAQAGVKQDDVFVSWLPLYHDMGLIGAWLGSLYFGCPLVLMAPTAFLAQPQRWLRAIQDYHGTLSGGPNFGYELCVRRIPEADIAGLDLSSWRLAFNGAEPVMPQTLERFRERFGACGFRAEAMTPVYGLAEAAVALTFPPRGRGPLLDTIDRTQLSCAGLAAAAAPGAADALRFVSCGRALPGYRLRVIDAAGSEVAERVEGVVQFAGPSATDGYYSNEQATALLVQGVWRNTGDRGYLAGGELYVTGRAKDIIIRRGRHIYPEEIERGVAELEGVRRGCVVAFGSIEPSTATEKLVVVAEVRTLDAAARARLMRAVNECVIGCIGEPPEEVLLVAPHTVLKTSSGKLRRAATRSAYEDGRLGRARASVPRQFLRLRLETLPLALQGTAVSAARVVYGVYAWAMFAAIAVPVMCATSLLDEGRAWRLTHRALHGVMRACGVSLSSSGAALDALPEPHVVVVNHASYVDSLFIAALMPTAHAFVANFAWQDLPLLRSFMRRIGTIVIDRSSSWQSAAQLASLQSALARGRSLIVFPEGGLVRQPGLGAFRLGAFRAAVDGAVPVVPIALRGTRSMLQIGDWCPRRASVSAFVCTPLTLPRGLEPFAAALRLRDEARAQILQHCEDSGLASPRGGRSG